MEKKLFEFKTKTIVATGLGAALFIVLFMYVKIPTGIPETDIKTAYGVGAFFAALFGPIAGGLIGPDRTRPFRCDPVRLSVVELGCCQRPDLLYHRSCLSEAESG